MSTVISTSVNPLVYTVKWTFGEAQPGKQMLLLWNLVQQWAAKNDAVPKGKVESEGNTMTVSVIIKRRLGPPRDASPLG